MKCSFIFSFLLLFSLFSFAIDCSNYYSSYSVTAKSFKADKQSYSPGETVKADFTLQNSFTAPLSQISFIALAKKGGNIFGQQSFTAPDLLANASAQVSFYWKIPRGSPNGAYSLELYAYSNAYSIGGHAHSPGTFVGEASFSVENPFEDYAFIDSNSLTFSNEKLDFSVTNNGREANAIVLFELMAGEEPKHSKLSAWFKEGRIPADSILGRMLASTSTTNSLLNKNNLFSLKSNSSTQIIRTLPALPPGFYVLKITAMKDDGKSIALVPMRVGRQPELLFLSPEKFPTQASEPSSAAACVSPSISPNATLVLRVRANSQPPDSSTSKIQESFFPQAFPLSFTPSALTRKLFIDAALFNENNSLIDLGEAPFDYSGFGKQKTLSLNSSVSQEKISYSIAISDEFGQASQAGVDLLVFRNGEIREVINGLSVNGVFSGEYLADETGEYNFTAIIPETQQQAVSSANVSFVPAKPKPLELLPAGLPQPPKIDYTSLLIIIFLMLSLILAFFFWKAGRR